MDAKDLRALRPELDRFLDTYAPLFGREQSRSHGRLFVQGLLRGGDRRNAENIAEALDGPPVRTLQAFLATGAWSDAAVLGQMRRDLLAGLADDDAVVNADETGFPKKGTKSVGVKRQYSGTLGRTDNCQIGVFLNYASANGHAFLDRRLFLPQEWAADADRREEAGVPEAVVFRTKPQLALEMVMEAVAAGVPFRWVGGDSVYGDNPTFVSGVRDVGKWYVVDVSCDGHVWTDEPTVVPADERPRPTRGRTPTRPQVIGTSRRVDEVVAALPAGAWRRVSVGEGSQGPRWYEYAEVPVWFREDGLPGPAERLLVRRSLGQAAEVKYHRSNAPAAIPLAKLAAVRGLRWTVEEDIQTGKGECGLDEYETRGWVGWHHHTALSLLALAFLVLQKRRLGEKTRRPDGARGAGGAGAPAGRAGVGRSRDPDVVPVATRAEPAGGGKPPQTPPRRSATTN